MKPEYVYQTDTPPELRDLWQTPPNIFNYFNQTWRFTHDVAASSYNHLVDNYFTEQDNALSQSWGLRNWCNPPYSEIGLWVEKAIQEAERGNATVMLVPANTDTKWFLKAVESPYCHIEFLVGTRIRFIRADTKQPVGNNTRGSIFITFHNGRHPIKFSYINKEIFNA